MHRAHPPKSRRLVGRAAHIRNLITMNTTDPDQFNLSQHGLAVTEIHRNLPPSALYEHATRYEKDASIAENGALVAYSGVKTGRSPKDKRVVRHPESEK